MSKSINKVILIGHLGNVPEIRVTQDNKKIASFNLATSENWYDKESGEKREKTDWHRVVIYSQSLVEVVEKFLTKGDKVYVEGSLHNRQWVDDDHVNHFITEIVLQNFGSNLCILSNKRKGPEVTSTEEAINFNLTTK